MLYYRIKPNGADVFQKDHKVSKFMRVKGPRELHITTIQITYNSMKTTEVDTT